MISWMAAQREVKTHRAACAIDDFIDDSKQALSMISWMAAQRKGKKTRTQTGLHLLLSPDLIAAKLAKGFYNVEFSTRPSTLVHFEFFCKMGRKGNRKSASQKAKQRDDNRERMSKSCNKKAEELAAKDSVAREQALTKLGVKEKFNFEDHKEIYNYSAEAVAAPIQMVDANFAPPEKTVKQLYEELDKPIDPSTLRVNGDSWRFERLTTTQRAKKIMQMNVPKVK